MDIQELILLTSRDILPFILQDIRPGFSWSGLPQREVVASDDLFTVFTQATGLNIYAPPGAGTKMGPGFGAMALPGLSGPGDGADWLAGARLRSDGTAGM